MVIHIGQTKCKLIMYKLICNILYNFYSFYKVGISMNRTIYKLNPYIYNAKYRHIIKLIAIKWVSLKYYNEDY